MKNIIVFILISFLSVNSFAQYKEVQPHENKDEERGGFQKDHLFTGGGVQLSLSNYDFVVGASPVIGYSFNKWFDAGIGFSYLHISEKEAFDDGYNVYLTGNKTRLNDYAPFAFAKFYPLKFMFIQTQFEENFITAKYIQGGVTIQKNAYNVSSLLMGVGYCGGRENVGDAFYYISLSIDVLKNKRSPYVQQVFNSNYEVVNVTYLPVLRAGIQIPLFQGKKR
ncbi:MAG: hypothetical protein QM737_13795 [Ferruginibacter sp.]